LKELLAQRAINLADLNNKELRDNLALLPHSQNARIVLQDNKESQEREEKSKLRELKIQSIVPSIEDQELEEGKCLVFRDLVLK
jgi:hypothetical protein